MQIAEQNKQSVIQSAHLAKATFQKDGHFEIVIVHKESTLNEYYWAYTARTKRSPRKSWKFIQAFPRDLNPNFFADFDSFVAHYAETKGAEFVACRVQDARGLARIATGYAIKASVNPNITKEVMWRMRDKANGTYNDPRIWRKALANKLDKAEAEKKPFQIPDNEVHVYMDSCEECLKVHSFAHFPSGKNYCKMDYQAMCQHPGFRFAKFEQTIRGFVFTSNSAAAGRSLPPSHSAIDGQPANIGPA